MRIGINAFYLIPGKIGGTEVYLRNLLEEFTSWDLRNEYVLFLNQGAKFFFPEKENLKKVILPIPSPLKPIRALFEQIVFLYLVKKYNLDILHSPGYVCPLLDINCAKVVTIFDLQYFHFPKNFSFPKRIYWQFFIPLSAKKAHKIITVSSYSKSDICNNLKIVPEKVEVIPLAVDPIFFREKKEKVTSISAGGVLKLPEPFILSVSTFNPHKNIEKLIDAFSLLKKNAKIPHKLILVGIKQRNFYSIVRRIKNLNLSKEVIILTNLPTEYLPDIYSRADLFVFPSFFEGFGLPPLEAMACSCPVVSSNATALPEVVNGGAILFNPINVEELAEAIVTVITNPEVKKQLIFRGLQVVRRYSWTFTAKETLRVYEEAVKIYKIYNNSRF